jgi:hypothetical protein
MAEGRIAQHALYEKRLLAIPYVQQKTEAEMKELDNRRISIREMISSMEIQIRDLLNNKREKNKIGNLFSDSIENIGSNIGVDECIIILVNFK